MYLGFSFGAGGSSGGNFIIVSYSEVSHLELGISGAEA